MKEFFGIGGYSRTPEIAKACRIIITDIANLTIITHANTIPAIPCIWSFRRRNSGFTRVIVGLVIAGFFGAGLIFSVGADNVYARGNLVLLTYAFVIVCYGITLILAFLAVRRNGHIRFFPVYYFVIPSLLGTLVQGMFYGISTGWMLTSIALLFVQLHIANQNAYEDDLSGLYNRKYFGWMVEKLTRSKNNAFIGAIMMDIDRFKSINDKFGHSVGDDAIRSFGWILTNITTATTIAFRVGGDEFIVLHIGGTEEDLAKIKDAINEQLDEFNETEGKPYTLAVSMGASTCYTNDTSLDFFFHQLKEFYPGFVLFAEMALRRGIDIPIYAAYLREKTNVFMFDKPILYSELRKKFTCRTKMAEYLLARTNALLYTPLPVAPSV